MSHRCRRCCPDRRRPTRCKPRPSTHHPWCTRSHHRTRTCCSRADKRPQHHKSLPYTRSRHRSSCQRTCPRGRPVARPVGPPRRRRPSRRLCSPHPQRHFLCLPRRRCLAGPLHQPHRWRPFRRSPRFAPRRWLPYCQAPSRPMNPKPPPHPPLDYWLRPPACRPSCRPRRPPRPPQRETAKVPESHDSQQAQRPKVRTRQSASSKPPRQRQPVHTWHQRHRRLLVAQHQPRPDADT